MEDNLHNSSGARSASEALSKTKENRQRQTSTSQFSQMSKPRITPNVVPQNTNNNSNNNSDDSGCGWILWVIIFFVIGFAISSML